jgi:L-fucose mutarotase
MLKNLSPVLGPELLYVLRAMGHGDEIAIVDGNYPADNAGPEHVIRADGHDVLRMLDAILSVMPLDEFVPDPAVHPQVPDKPDHREPVMLDIANVIAKHEPKIRVQGLEPAAFYNRVRKAYAVVGTSERRLYGNVILKKGVIRPGEGPD